MTMHENDRFLTFDAAYVLGALSPEDRQVFELHFRECAECARSVQELAGLPGLLSQVNPGLVEGAPLPPGLLPSMLTLAQRSRRRRLMLTMGAVTAAAAACLALVVTVALPRTSTGSPGVTMTALGDFPVRADIGLEDQAWGTRVSMSCSYRGGRSGDYVLVAVRRDGGVAELASWGAVPKDTARVVVGTTLHRGEIQALEVRTRSGLSLLRLAT